MATLFGGKKNKRKRSRREVASSDALFSNNEEDQEGSSKKQAPNTLKEAPSSSTFADSDEQQSPPASLPTTSFATTFADLGLAEPLVATCRQLGLVRPTPIQRTLIPYLLQHANHHVLALASTGSGKTASYVLPILHRLQADPYGIYAVVLCPTRELAKQVHQHVLALGSAHAVTSVLVVGGESAVKQSCQLDRRPHIVVATPGRWAQLLQGPHPPNVARLRFLVLDEADRLLSGGSQSGFEKDVAELLLHRPGVQNSNASSLRHHREPCQTLLLSATMTQSLTRLEELVSSGKQERLPLKKFVLSQDDDDDDEATTKAAAAGGESNQLSEPKESSAMISKLPAGLQQEYLFLPSRVRNAYLLTVLRTLMVNGGRSKQQAKKDEQEDRRMSYKKKKASFKRDDKDDEESFNKARSAIVFVSTCERAALVSGLLTQVGVPNVALHSLLSQNRRWAALGSFKSQHVSVLVATDVAARGLDIPTVDLVVNSELPRQAVNYVHRVGRTARAGRRGRAVSLVAETDIALVKAVERVTGRPLEKCTDVTEDMVLPLLGPAAKATRLTKMKLADMGFDELVQKFKERKARDVKERKRLERKLARMEGKQQSSG